MTPAESELQWLLTLLKPPYTQGWSAYCEKKAEGLARKYPQEYAELPVMLREARGRLSSASLSVGDAAFPTPTSGTAATE